MSTVCSVPDVAHLLKQEYKNLIRILRRCSKHGVHFVFDFSFMTRKPMTGTEKLEVEQACHDELAWVPRFMTPPLSTSYGVSSERDLPVQRSYRL